jgi:hypothetical protein
MNITVFKAQQTTEETIPDMTITATEELPQHTGLAAPTIRFYEQARLIADALYDSLPGGTLDALLVEMLDRKRTLLRVKA